MSGVAEIADGAVLHISWSRKDQEKAAVMHCPTCKRRRRFYCWFQEWYGWHSTCCACGDCWQDGERGERPFERGWRKEAAGKAAANWNRIAKRGAAS